MITRIAIRDFKSFRDVKLDLGPMNLFVGANASGKSNFFDALRVLQGIGGGLTISDILDGRPGIGADAAWEGIRGGSALAGFHGVERAEAFVIEVEGRFSPGSQRLPWRYSITVSPVEGLVLEESLVAHESEVAIFRASSRPTADGARWQVDAGPEGAKPVYDRHAIQDLDPETPLLGHFGTRDNQCRYCWPIARQLRGIQRLDPEPKVLRRYSNARPVVRMGEHGEDFAALIKHACLGAAKDDFLGWLRELRPEEIENVDAQAGAANDLMFVLCEGGRRIPAPVLSDGTLRFAAIAAAFFQPEMPDMMIVEEIEKSLHASRSRLVVELLRVNAEAGRTQVMATTHSPAVLSWVKESEYGTTYLCRRDESNRATRVLPLSDIPNFLDVVGRHSIADLLVEGWLESAS